MQEQNTNFSPRFWVLCLKVFLSNPSGPPKIKKVQKWTQCLLTNVHLLHFLWYRLCAWEYILMPLLLYQGRYWPVESLLKESRVMECVSHPKMDHLHVLQTASQWPSSSQKRKEVVEVILSYILDRYSRLARPLLTETRWSHSWFCCTFKCFPMSIRRQDSRSVLRQNLCHLRRISSEHLGVVYIVWVEEIYGHDIAPSIPFVRIVLGQFSMNVRTCVLFELLFPDFSESFWINVSFINAPQQMA